MWSLFCYEVFIVSFLVLQSSCRRREMVHFDCLLDVMWLLAFFVSFSWYLGYVCGVWIIFYMVYKTSRCSNWVIQWITWRTNESSITVYVISFTAMYDCNSFLRTDLAIQILISHLLKQERYRVTSLRMSTSREVSY